MSWRVITIQKPAQLSLKSNQLSICQPEQDEATIPIEDICALILECPQINLTSALLSMLQNQNVVVITCDSRHTPNGLLTSFHQHSRLSEVAHLQIQWSGSYRNRCWQALIQQKITNQAKCLEIVGNANFHKIKILAKRVESGDKKNVEAFAARYYWQYLFSADFRRKQDTVITSSLNYGYSIARSMICRALVAYGLLPCFGVHHSNSLNAFNLADDILEPFRPIVDLYVWKMINEFPLQSDLTKEMRAHLVGISILPCIINNQVQVFHNAAEFCASSLAATIRQKSITSLKLPSLYHG